MTQALTPMQTFEEKVKARLKETIADMLPDEALATLTQRAVDEQFFKERVTVDQYNRVSSKEPSWFVQEVAKLAEPIIKAHVAKAFEERRAEIEAAVEKFCADQNIALLMTASMTSQMSAAMWDHAGRIVEQVKRGY